MEGEDLEKKLSGLSLEESKKVEYSLSEFNLSTTVGTGSFGRVVLA